MSATPAAPAHEQEGVVDLAQVGDELLRKAADSPSGRAVRAVLRQPGQSLILLAFTAGGLLPDHDAPGPASLHCLSGEVVLSSGGQSWHLRSGSAVVIPQRRHEVRAVVESLCVLTVSLPLPPSS